MGRGGAIKAGDEEVDLMNDLMTKLFVKQPLDSLGFA